MTPRRHGITGAALSLLICVSISACAPLHAHDKTHSDRAASRELATIETTTFAAVGDSITAWIDRTGVHKATTWVSYAAAHQLDFLDDEGWAAGGAKLAEMQANVTPVTADVLVIMAGTNDLGDRWGTPIDERLASVSRIVEQSGASHVIISAIAPLNSNPTWSSDYNFALQQYAALNGWVFVDPWTQLRTPDGLYVDGYTIDGIHPTAEGERLVGLAMRDAILEVAPVS